MNFLYKIFKQDPTSRQGVITITSSLGIAANSIIAIIKIVAGLAVSSIAVVSEGVNNATDALGSIIALVGARLSGKHPTEKHPFGFGRIEYLTGLIISFLIILSGYELLKESIHLIRNPAELNISVLTISIVAVTAVIKLLLGIYTIRMGNKINSNALKAIGVEGKQDSFVSVITIISAILFIIYGVSIDAYAGIIISLIIIKAGLGALAGTVSDILGTKGDKELAEKLYSRIRSTDGIINVADMMLHSYGPDRYSGSVNVEIDHSKTVGEIYKVLHDLQLRIMHEDNITMVFGIYAVDNDTNRSNEMRLNIAAFIKDKPLIKSFHALYFDENEDKIYCDFIVDYREKDWDGLRNEFTRYMKDLYPTSSLELVIETEYV